MKNPNEEFFRYIETLRQTQEKESIDLINLKSKKKIANKQEKVFLSLPDNVIKTRIRSAILSILLEYIEKKELFLTENDITGHIKVKELMKCEPNALKFFETCMKEIHKKFLKIEKIMEREFYVINEEIWKKFFRVIQEKVKGK